MKGKTRIQLTSASLGYSGNNGGTAVLKDINLEFCSGDFVAVVGLNGSGKSTLLKSMCGLLPLLGGVLELDGKDLRKTGLQAVATKIAIVLTERVGGFNLNVFDAVAAGQLPYTNAFHRLEGKHLGFIDAALNTVGLNDYRDKLLNELSDGLFQKTMIARALAQQTPSILLDEPSAFLDYASKHELFLLLKKFALEENKCVLVSTHDLDLALKYCPSILVVTENKVELIKANDAHNCRDFLQIGRGFI